MLARQGTVSEARQYSGRNVLEPNGECPFNPVERTACSAPQSNNYSFKPIEYVVQ
jgi:hypothetical protein